MRTYFDARRTAKDVKQAQEFLDALKGYGEASKKTIRRAERAVALKDKMEWLVM